jgi:group I intron endonuclease
MNSNIGIYLISNPKGKIYIGKSKDIKSRFYRYNKLLCKSQIKIYNSLKKYSPSNHNFIVLINCDIQYLDYFEKYYIRLFNSFKEGLNCTNGGEGSLGRLMSNETREKLSKSLLGRKSWNEGLKMSVEHKLKLSIASTNKGKKNYAQSERMKNNIPHNRKKVFQYDLNLNLINQFISADSAFKKTNIRHITSVCRNERKTAGGYIWKYEQSN